MKTIHFLMLALEAMLSCTVGAAVRVFAEAVTIEGLEDRLITLNQGMQAIQARADAENRDLTSEESATISAHFTEFENVEADIERRKRLASTNARLAQGTGRQTDATAVNQDPAGTRASAAASGRAPATTRPRVEDDRRGGFRNFGEFAQSVKIAVRQGGNVDPRLTVLNAAPTASSEGVGADGGYAVPPEFRAAIMEKVMAEDSLIGRTDQLTSSSNSITIPKDETTPWQGTGGIQAYWEGENKQHTETKVALESTTIRLNKIVAMVKATDELMEDASALSSYITRKAPIKIDFKITDGIINGNGVGMPLGLIASACAVTVAKESAQTAQTVVFNNIAKMWARMYAGCRKGAIWLAQQDIEPQLIGMQFPGTGTAVPVYLPPGGLSASPYGMLMGRPVIPMESCQALGTKGDLILTDLSTYLTAQKVAGMRQEVSIHLHFDYDVSTFKFVLRVAGQPWWTGPIVPANGSNNRSCTVMLADRA